MKTSHVYIITNDKNGTLYTGVTNNIIRRVYEHKNKLTDGFSSKYALDRLVYLEQFLSIEDAIAAEKRIKGWARAKKVALIEARNPDWNDLALDSSQGSE